MANELTPMMRQYMAMKRDIPAGAILMFRLGDFYEMFGEDAAIASPILGATLTQRNGVPMCGVPYHALDSYLAKLIRAGKTAALCDQVEDPKTAKGLVRREITRIVTPGTVTEDGLLADDANTFVAAVYPFEAKESTASATHALAMLDLSTGEFFAEEHPGRAALDEALERYRPAEILQPSPDAEWTFMHDAALDTLLRHFKVASLDGFGLAGRTEVVSAAGALLHYVHTTLRHNIDHVRRITLRSTSDSLVLDAATLRHLQLLPGGEVAKAASLLGILDATKTAMGARTLRSWIQAPLASAAAINARLDAVGAFVEDRYALTSLRQLLGGVRDLERLVAKVDSLRANPRDLKALAASLAPLPEIKRVTLEASASSAKIAELAAALKPQDALVDMLARAIADDPPALMADGGFIAQGFDAELDECRRDATEAHRWMADYQAREQERTGIPKLKVKHVPAFGFLIEVPKSFSSRVPSDYTRRQTLTTGERYVTEELKEHERRVLGAQDRAVAIEQRLFREIIEAVTARSPEIQSTAGAIGRLDAILSLADRALAAGYVRPVVDESDVLEIVDGRHPIVEQLPDAEPFVPNSAFLDCTANQIILITGPNMAGKSTYIRQVAVIAVMAHMGSFVPAASMRTGALDRVFTRIGAGDDLARGRSTFLVEMQETANILNNATPRSLIVLDEIGRGTSTFDGISIAWAVAEYLHGKASCKAKTLFATHYHELTDLADALQGVKNYTVKVKEENGRVIFLRRIVPGIAERSFGINVGAMAGLPREVVARASDILKNLEDAEIDPGGGARAVRKPRRRLSELPGQMSFEI